MIKRREICKYCGNKIEKGNAKTEYCNPRCKTYNYREKKRKKDKQQALAAQSPVSEKKKLTLPGFTAEIEASKEDKPLTGMRDIFK